MSVSIIVINRHKHMHSHKHNYRKLKFRVENWQNNMRKPKGKEMEERMYERMRRRFRQREGVTWTREAILRGRLLEFKLGLGVRDKDRDNNMRG